MMSDKQKGSLGHIIKDLEDEKVESEQETRSFEEIQYQPQEGNRVIQPGRNQQQIAALMQEMRGEFEKTREEFAKATEIERLQESIDQLRSKNEELRRERDELQERLGPSDATEERQEDYNSTEASSFSESTTVNPNRTVSDKRLQIGVAVVQISFLIAGIAVALTPYIDSYAIWPQSAIVTAPIWFSIAFLFMLYERHIIAQGRGTS